MTPFDCLVRENLAVLDQGLDLLATLDDALYARPEPRVGSSGIGAHFRHVLDHYDRFLDGVESGHVDYDARVRDAATEAQRTRAVTRLALVRAAVESLSPTVSGRRLTVRLDAGHPDGGPAPLGGSTPERELQSLLSHTVHHYALIALLLRLAGRDPGPSFGVAPSTLRHWQETRACAR